MQAGRIGIFDAAHPMHRNSGGMRVPLQPGGGGRTATAEISEEVVLRHCKCGRSILDPRRKYDIIGTWGETIKKNMKKSFRMFPPSDGAKRSNRGWQRQRRFFTVPHVEMKRQSGKDGAQLAALGIP